MEPISCPNCGASCNAATSQCENCGSYVIVSNATYTDLSDRSMELPQRPDGETGQYPGIYVFGRLLGTGERPIALGLANYFTGAVSAGGKLLLTNKSLSFSAHAFNVGRQFARIDLKRITDVKVSANLLISQHIVVTANGQAHKFVVYHGKKWVRNIKDAIANYEE